MSVARAKGAKGRADRLWSEVVRMGRCCVSCARPDNLQAHHLISRRYNATRHVLDNGWPLCAACHREVHENPVLFVELIDLTIGRSRYDELRAMTIGTCTYRESDWIEIADGLKARRAEILDLIDRGEYPPARARSPKRKR